MQILSLRLDNTKSYHQAEISFADGVNAIVGHNGAGKSTILEAIGFVLFDALEYKHDDFVREGVDSAEIMLTFQSSLDGRVYQVVRRCGASTQYRVFDPELSLKVCEGKADTLRFLRQQMGVEPGFDLPSLFRDAVGVPQGAFTAIFLESAARRKPTFDRLLQVEEYSRAADRLREPARILRERRQSLEVALAGLSARLERLAPLQQSVSARTVEIQTTSQAITQLEAQLAQQQQARAALEQQQQELTSLRNRQVQVSSQVESIASQLASLSQALQQAQAARATLLKHQAEHDLYVATQARQQTLDGQVRQREQLERQRAGFDKRLAQSETEAAQLARELADIAAAEATVASLVAAVTRQEELEAALNRAQQQQARLEDAQQQHKTQASQVQQLRARLAELTQQLAQSQMLETESHTCEAQIQQARLAIDRAKETQIACKNSADAIKKQNEALADLQTAKCPVCEQPLSDGHRHQMLQRNEQRLNELRTDYKRLTEQIRQQEAELQAAETNRKQLQQQLLRLPRPAEQQQTTQELSTAEANWQHTSALVEQLTNAPATVAQLQTELRTLGDPRQQQAVAAATAGRRAAVERLAAQQAEQQKSVREQMAACLAELEQFAQLDGALEQVRATLRQTEPAYRAVLTVQQQAATVEQITSERTTAEARHTAAVDLLAQIGAALAQASGQFDPAELARVASEEQQARSQLSSLQTQLALLQQQQQADEHEIAQLARQQVEHEQLSAQKAQNSTQEEVLDALRDLLKKAGPQVTKALIHQVSSSADQIFCEMMQDYTRRLSWQEDYSITLEVEGRLRQFAQLSGGEQMCAALAVRLALLREMSNIDVAFFDEPTANLDDTRRDALVRQILEVKGFRQLFVISHDDTFEQATQNLIRVERVDGISVVHTNG